jgi:predicted nucleic acid-binding protein
VADDIGKKNTVKDILLNNENIVISSQIINEFVAVVIRKNILSADQAFCKTVLQTVLLIKRFAKSFYGRFKKRKLCRWTV